MSEIVEVVEKKSKIIRNFSELSKKVRNSELTYSEIHKTAKALLKKDDKDSVLLRADKLLLNIYQESLNMFIFSDPKYNEKPNLEK